MNHWADEYDNSPACCRRTKTAGIGHYNRLKATRQSCSDLERTRQEAEKVRMEERSLHLEKQQFLYVAHILFQAFQDALLTFRAFDLSTDFDFPGRPPPPVPARKPIRPWPVPPSPSTRPATSSLKRPRPPNRDFDRGSETLPRNDWKAKSERSAR